MSGANCNVCTKSEHTVSDGCTTHILHIYHHNIYFVHTCIIDVGLAQAYPNYLDHICNKSYNLIGSCLLSKCDSHL